MLQPGSCQSPWGIPFKITPHIPPDQMVVINNGRELLLGEGGVLADKIEYGEENGIVIGPLTRLKRDNDKAYESAKRNVHHAWAIASIELLSLQRELQLNGNIEERFQRELRRG